MASDLHQTICGLIIRKMICEGYSEVYYFDGSVYDGYFSEFDVPPTIGRHRPDCICFNPVTKKYAIGEAKTILDIESVRTEEEINDFCDACLGVSPFDRVIIGYPSEGEKEVFKLVQKISEDRKEVMDYFVYYEGIDEGFEDGL